MPAITYGKLLAEAQAMAAAVGRDAERHLQLAAHFDAEAQDTARISEQIGALGVDDATVAETSELSRSMRGLSQATIVYANAADNVARAARATEQQNLTDHAGISEARRSAPINALASPGWYTQE